MSSDQQPEFDQLPEVQFDEVYGSIREWAEARKRPEDYTSFAKDPVIPFAPLTREIGVSPVDDTETREMTIDYQQQISNWVGLVKSPFDVIQRAEGFETPQSVFYGGQNRAAKHADEPLSRAIIRSSSGRAAIRRQYDRTLEHYETAKDRAEQATTGLTKLKNSGEFTVEARNVTLEILQELANGLAANLDNKFPGNDHEARIAGNSILAVADGVEKGTIDPLDVRRLVYAAVGYVKKQERFWETKLPRIFDFAAEKGFSVGQQSEDEE